MQLHMSRSSALASVVLGGLVIGACAGTSSGTRDPSEPHDLDMAANPGNEFCQGTVNVNQASQYAGATLRWQVEAFEQDSNGNKRPIKSTGGAYKLPG